MPAISWIWSRNTRVVAALSGSISASTRDISPRSDGCNWPVAEYVAGPAAPPLSLGSSTCCRGPNRSSAKSSATEKEAEKYNSPAQATPTADDYGMKTKK
jgi:hypothetical protein